MNWINLPVWSPRLILLAAGALLVAGLVRWRREGRGAGPLLMRTLLILGLAGVLFNPNAFLPRQDPGRRRLILLLDTSASMGTRDVNSQSRLGAALRVLKDPGTRSRLERSFDLETRTFDRGQRPARLDDLSDSSALGDATDTGAAINAAIADLGETGLSAGILLVSDGRATEPGADEAAQLALAKSVPLWVWPLGGVVPRRDLWIETPASEALSFSGAEVDLSGTLHVEGYSNRTFQVEVLQDGRRVAFQEVLPGTNGTARILAHVTAPASGEQRILFRAVPQPDEADIANNERAIFLRSVGARARVLIAEAQPHWDTKFLVQSLKRDSRIDLTAVYRLNATRHLALVSSTGTETRVEKDLFPRTAEAMNAFDVILLGRGADAFFDAGTEGLLTDFVALRGGALVFSRGRPYGARFQPLAKLEPVAWGSGIRSSVKLRPTPLAREHPIFDLGTGSAIDDILEKLPALDQASVTL